MLDTRRKLPVELLFLHTPMLLMKIYGPTSPFCLCEQKVKIQRQFREDYNYHKRHDFQAY